MPLGQVTSTLAVVAAPSPKCTRLSLDVLKPVAVVA
jgi:hypothetical protein